MRTYPWIPALLLCLALAGTGCAPPFPRDMLDKIDRSVSFGEIRSNPEKFRGRWAMLGGMIVDIKNAKEGTLIEVLQKPLERNGRPERTDRTEGRFIVQSGEFLDAAVYHAGRDITIVGEVAGDKTMRLGEVEYRYPLLTVKALHLWEPYSGPRFFFSIGVWHQL